MYISEPFKQLFEFKTMEEKIDHMAHMISLRVLSEIDKICDKRGITHRTLATHLAVSDSFLSQVFRGHKLVSARFIAKIEEILQVEFKVQFIETINMAQTIGKSSSELPENEPDLTDRRALYDKIFDILNPMMNPGMTEEAVNDILNAINPANLRAKSEIRAKNMGFTKESILRGCTLRKNGSTVYTKEDILNAMQIYADECLSNLASDYLNDSRKNLISFDEEDMRIAFDTGGGRKGGLYGSNFDRFIKDYKNPNPAKNQDIG